jgi:DNA-binding response OmpR family regulator
MPKILVVDDEEAIRLFYEEELSGEGYEVMGIGDGSRVIEMIEQQSPHVILMEIFLGKYDGFDLLQDIRNTYYNLPVILCTAYSRVKCDPRSMAADYCLLKGSDLRELKLRIKMALEAEASSALHTDIDRAGTIPLEHLQPNGKAEGTAGMYSGTILTSFMVKPFPFY